MLCITYLCHRQATAPWLSSGHIKAVCRVQTPNCHKFTNTNCVIADYYSAVLHLLLISHRQLDSLRLRKASISLPSDLWSIPGDVAGAAQTSENQQAAIFICEFGQLPNSDNLMHVFGRELISIFVVEEQFITKMRRLYIYIT